MSVTTKKLDAIQVEIDRYQRAVNDLYVCRQADKRGRGSDLYLAGYPRETGAIKRASMDLSRALVKVRKSGGS